MKLLPASYILNRARDRGEIGPATTVIETTSGTFGLGLAMQCALWGNPLTLISDPAVDERLARRLADLGATLEIICEYKQFGGYQAARLERLREIQETIPDTYCPEQYSNPDNPRSYALVAELVTETLGQVDCVIGAVGSGGSMCGTVGFLRTIFPETGAIGVDTHRSVLFGHPDGPRSIRGLGNSLMPANLDHCTFDEIHWVTPSEAYVAARNLHSQYALFMGPTSGAAYLVAQRWARLHLDQIGIVILPDQGYRYQDTIYDDAWLTSYSTDLIQTPKEPTLIETSIQPAEGWSYYMWGRRTYEEVLGRPFTPAS
jgi:cysteine synthase